MKPEVIDSKRLSEILADRYPAIAADADELLPHSIYMQMGTLARATQAAISNHEVAIARGLLDFIGDIYRLATSDVRNAVCVSYLEQISFDGKHGKQINARGMLSKQLQEVLGSLEAYNAELFKQR